MRHAYSSLRRDFQSAWTAENYTPAIILLVLCLGGLILWQRLGDQDWGDLWPELGGMIFDIMFIVVLFGFFQHRNRRLAEAERQREIIDDFKRWDAPEARLHIAGAIRRLNRQAIFAVNLAGARLSDFDFAGAGIKSLSGSTFYDGAWGDPHHRSEVALSNVSFDHVDCSNVCFSPFDPFDAWPGSISRHAKFRDCTFIRTNLEGARFNGAFLEWSAPPPVTLYEVEEDEDGRPYTVPTGYGPFDGVSLKAVSFRGTSFKNADFRGADEVEAADFYRAIGLEDALFDNDEIKAQAIMSARRD